MSGDPVTVDRLPFARVSPPRRRVLDRVLARPSLAAVVGLAVVVLVFGLRVPELLTPEGLAGVLDQAALLGIGGVAVGLLLVGGHFDLSIGTVAVASSVLTGVLVGQQGWGVWPALLLSLACALAVGTVNGWLVVRTGLPSFLVTLATALVLQGTTLSTLPLVAGAPRISGLDVAPGWSSASALFGSTAEVGGGVFPVSLLWWLAATAGAGWLLWRTRFGNEVLAMGGSRRAAAELGVPVPRTTFVLYALTATAGWLLGTLALVPAASVAATPSLTTAIDLVVVAVLGGCLLTGGYGSMAGAAVGALLYAVARSGFELSGWDPRWSQVLLGVLLLVALAFGTVVRGRLRAAPRS
ncbi:monosaccharide ABC transporter membrane protein, CUT2 family [Geodermatophilus nigrescens]|uniref:Xylose transport system permease protein XylH n=1 Tax=Geodermatophilus nigrescens TaxID=1070870 RepID=A0A1M5M5W8_9ACTN|nr:monosaccharide ABC transporter membrane protein, CUT2 family [Geodermatophilus nigrescens]